MIAAVVAVVVAFVGYLWTHWSNRRLAQRQERLVRVNRQLSEFYGPLLALTEINSRVYHAFTDSHPHLSGASPLLAAEGGQSATREEQAEWRAWIEKVFLPNHRAMRDILLTKADLLAEDHMPEILTEVYAHAARHELAVACWQAGDLTYEPATASASFPAGQIRQYARENFDRLKREQSRLLGG